MVQEASSYLRIPISDTIFQLAETWGARSTCPRSQAGCVIIDADNYVLASGYVGAPKGLPHCMTEGCLMEGVVPCPNGCIPQRGLICVDCNGTGKTPGHCVRTIHAEMNAIIFAAKRGVSLKDSALYSTLRPCIRCANAIVQVGISRVYYSNDYRSDSMDDVERIFALGGVRMEKKR